MFKKFMQSFFYRFRPAFTLAEVLITLGIIGVVAALSIPHLITSYQKIYVESHVKKFYSTLNNALKLSAAENGDPSGWVVRDKNYSHQEMHKILDTYISPYYKHGSVWDNPQSSSGQYFIATEMVFGGVMLINIDKNGMDILYKPFDNKFRTTKNSPRNKFQFQLSKYVSDKNKGVNSPDFVEPYIFNWKGTNADLKNNATWGCRKGCTNCGYCTKMLQLNGWKIPKDYPW